MGGRQDKCAFAYLSGPTPHAAQCLGQCAEQRYIDVSLCSNPGHGRTLESCCLAINMHINYVLHIKCSNYETVTQDVSTIKQDASPPDPAGLFVKAVKS